MNFLSMTTLFLSFFLASCSLLIENEFDKYVPIDKKNEIQINKSFCQRPQKQNTLILSKNKFIKDYFSKKIASKKKYRTLKLEEKFVILALLNTNLRPDVAAANANFQVYIRKNGKSKYFNYNKSPSNPYPFYHGLEKLLQISKSKYSLLQLARITNSLFPPPYIISNSLANSLKAAEDTLKSHSIFRKYFFKAGEILMANESLSGMDIVSIVRNYQKSTKKISNKNSTLSKIELLKVSTKNKNLIFLCNANFNKLGLSTNSITKDNGNNNLPLAIAHHNGDAIFASINSTLNKTPEALFNKPLFSSKKTDSKTTFCSVQNKNNHTNLLLFSMRGRDSSQIFQNFFHSDLSRITTKEEVREIIEYPRSIFLKNPKRLILESERSHKKNLENFLKLRFPTYHHDKLGEIWAYIKSEKDNTFITDSRDLSFINCQ